MTTAGTRSARAAGSTARSPTSEPGKEAFRAWFFQFEATRNGARDWTAFDHTLAVARSRGVKVVATLVNQWGQCEGWSSYADGYKGESWYASGYRTLPSSPGMPATYREWVAEVVSRYNDDPTILAWQLVNEAEAKTSYGGSCSSTAPATAEGVRLRHGGAGEVHRSQSPPQPGHDRVRPVRGRGERLQGSAQRARDSTCASTTTTRPWRCRVTSGTAWPPACASARSSASRCSSARSESRHRPSEALIGRASSAGQQALGPVRGRRRRGPRLGLARRRTRRLEPRRIRDRAPGSGSGSALGGTRASYLTKTFGPRYPEGRFFRRPERGFRDTAPGEGGGSGRSRRATEIGCASRSFSSARSWQSPCRQR